MGNASVDLVIRGGTVVDGTGAPARTADVAIDDDRIVAVGELDTTGRREIDADGLHVAPGIVDIHTHLDAQIGWDPVATSSCWHGVTSVVLGNCGVTFAPCKPEDRRYLAEMMESVEDIPADSIMDGLPWDWETYGEYLDTIERLPKGVHVGGMVGHCAVRYYVMGDDSVDPSIAATPEQIAAMAELVDEAMGAGALGFSSSRTFFHHTPTGEHVPGTFARREEMLAIGAVLGRHGRGVFELAPQALFELTPDALAHLVDEAARVDPVAAEVGWMADVSRHSGRPVSFGFAHTDHDDDLYRRVLDCVDAEVADGARLHPQSTVRGVGVLFTLTGMTPFDRTPAWAELQAMPPEQRLASIADPERRRRLVTDGADARRPAFFERIFVIDPDDVRYDYGPDDSLAAHAARAGEPPAETFLRLAEETGGRSVCNYPLLNQSFDAIADILHHPQTVLGLGDAGAHVGQIMDSSMPTYFLAHWVRDRGAFTLEDGVRRLTSEPASLFGIDDRGVLAPGKMADVMVFDLEALGLEVPELVSDFPGGARRYIQRSRGHAASVVGGRVFMEGGEHTGELAGTVLRGGR